MLQSMLSCEVKMLPFCFLLCYHAKCFQGHILLWACAGHLMLALLLGRHVRRLRHRYGGNIPRVSCAVAALVVVVLVLLLWAVYMWQ